MKFLLMSFILLTCSFMMFIKHPLTLGILILIQTFFICLLSGMMTCTYWFSYILFLIFAGGVLVMFIYVSSIASNELFKINFSNKSILLFFICFFILMSYYFSNNLSFSNFYFNNEMYNFFNMFMFSNNEFNFNLSKLYNEQTFFLLLMLVLYLFITLIAVVKITNIFKGPLRSSL
uniref:NADH-ubiquinone oxidoreductase chain 6 n=1 Tax=Bematistes alcinoe TaxID=502015 RepID=A0A140CVH1_9NEOP|nr:NADH dehydrogenase subunit 6 [Bematistes alcinoe]AMJ17295.1 NADH dehydrogenase subunit 6 [Bematistes alcinoe]